jgi:hypothetical protein
MTDEPYSRGSDPQTSWDAAGSIRGSKVNAVAKVVLLAIARSGERGANWMELSQMLPGFERQTISPRFKPLREAGLIQMHEEAYRVEIDGKPHLKFKTHTRPGWTGRSQIVWYATPKGMAYADFLKKLAGKN